MSPTPPEVFAVSLAVESATPGFSARLDPTATVALVEPWGVIQLSGQVYTGVEGQEVCVLATIVYMQTAYFTRQHMLLNHATLLVKMLNTPYYNNR